MIWILETVRHYYHKVQGKQDEHEVGAEELVYQMIQRYPSIHELLKQEHHHQAPKLLLLPISANKSGNCVLKENAFNVKIQYLTSGPMEQESGRPL